MIRRAIVAIAAAVVSIAILVSVSTTAHAVGFVVTIQAGASHGDVGDNFVFTGTVSPNQHGQPVALQRYYSGAWRTVALSTLNSASGYTIVWHADVHGALLFRVAFGYFGSFLSPQLKINVFRWHYLADLPVASSDCAKSCGTKAIMTINNTKYSVSWRVPQPCCGSPGDTWNLHQNCTTFRANIGIQDPGAFDASAILGERADTTNLDVRSYTDGVNRFRSLALYGRRRLTLWRSGYGIGDVYAGWGNARIRCLW